MMLLSQCFRTLQASRPTCLPRFPRASSLAHLSDAFSLSPSLASCTASCLRSTVSYCRWHAYIPGQPTERRLAQVRTRLHVPTSSWPFASSWSAGCGDQDIYTDAMAVPRLHRAVKAREQTRACYT